MVHVGALNGYADSVPSRPFSFLLGFFRARMLSRRAMRQSSQRHHPGHPSVPDAPAGARRREYPTPHDKACRVTGRDGFAMPASQTLKLGVTASNTNDGEALVAALEI